mgnify:CR=1 FL=1
MLKIVVLRTHVRLLFCTFFWSIENFKASMILVTSTFFLQPSCNICSICDVHYYSGGAGISLNISFWTSLWQHTRHGVHWYLFCNGISLGMFFHRIFYTYIYIWIYMHIYVVCIVYICIYTASGNIYTNVRICNNLWLHMKVPNTSVWYKCEQPNMIVERKL